MSVTAYFRFYKHFIVLHNLTCALTCALPTSQSPIGKLSRSDVIVCKVSRSNIILYESNYERKISKYFS